MTILEIGMLVSGAAIIAGSFVADKKEKKTQETQEELTSSQQTLSQEDIEKIVVNQVFVMKESAENEFDKATAEKVNELKVAVQNALFEMKQVRDEVNQMYGEMKGYAKLIGDTSTKAIEGVLVDNTTQQIGDSALVFSQEDEPEFDYSTYDLGDANAGNDNTVADESISDEAMTNLQVELLEENSREESGYVEEAPAPIEVSLEPKDDIPYIGMEDIIIEDAPEIPVYGGSTSNTFASEDKEELLEAEKCDGEDDYAKLASLRDELFKAHADRDGYQAEYDSIKAKYGMSADEIANDNKMLESLNKAKSNIEGKISKMTADKEEKLSRFKTLGVFKMAEKKTIQSDIDYINAQLDKEKQRLQSYDAEIDKVNKRIQSRDMMVEKKLEEVKAAMTKIDEVIAQLEAQISKLN